MRHTHGGALAPRWRRLAMTLAAVLLAAGCNDPLKVVNPGAIEPPSLGSPNYIPLMVNGVVGEFQPAFGLDAYYSGLFTDELRNHHVYFEEGLIDRRQVLPENGTYVAGIYNPLHRTRWLADSVASRLKAMLGDSASRNLGLARVLAYGGYSYVLLGEQLCQSALNGQPKRYTSAELLKDYALPRFQEAIAVATAAKAAAAGDSAKARAAGADSIKNLALIGAARAALDIGDKAQAIQFASQVPSGFVFWAYFSENSARENNPFYGRFVSSVSGSVTGTPFQGMQDPRVPLPTTPRTVGGVPAYVPNSPATFSTWSGTLPGTPVARSSGIQIASYIEAQYILAEAQGPDATTIAFINSRRAVGGDTALASNVSPADFFTAVRDQRRRDLYLNAHRLGDLRRYKDIYGIDEWQTGAYPVGTDTYGSQTCFPESLAELTNNPGT